MLTNEFKLPGNKLFLLITIPSLILIIINGLQKTIPFKVDSITISLLIIGAVPLLYQILDTIKAGGLKIEFRGFTIHKQMIVFLDGIASQKEWTFYTPRPGETEVGQGLKVLIDELINNQRKEFIKQVDEWFKSPNKNHRWFAAEIVGYAKLEGLKASCHNHFKSKDIDDTWESYQLNCLWAYSRFDKYDLLIRHLQTTKNEENKAWLVRACQQMIHIETDEALISLLKKEINALQLS